MPRPFANPSHRSIAQLAGVSCATVSMALKNHPRISAATQKKVIAVAKQLGYSPNAGLARVMTEVRRVNPDKPIIALPTDWNHPSPWESNPFMARFYSTVTQRAEELGFQIEEFWVHPKGISPKEFGKILNARNIPGLIIPPNFTAGKKFPFDLGNLAVVTHSKIFFKSQISKVEPNSLFNTMTALREIRKLGYRRVGLLHLGGASALQGTLLEIESAFAYYARRGWLGTPIEPFILDGFRLEDEAVDRMLQWIKTHRPDVIFSNCPGLKVLLEQNGISVPGDIGVVCDGVIPTKENTTGIDLNSEVLDSLLVDVVVTQINCGQRGIPKVPVTMSVEGKWVKGSTVMKVDSIGEFDKRENHWNDAQ